MKNNEMLRKAKQNIKKEKIFVVWISVIAGKMFGFN